MAPVLLWLLAVCGMSFTLHNQCLVVFQLGFLPPSEGSKLFCLKLSHKANGPGQTCSGWRKINGFTFTLYESFSVCVWVASERANGYLATVLLSPFRKSQLNGQMVVQWLFYPFGSLDLKHKRNLRYFENSIVQIFMAGEVIKYDKLLFQVFFSQYQKGFIDGIPCVPPPPPPPPPPGVHILSIPCSFREILAKSYVGAGYPPPPLPPAELPSPTSGKSWIYTILSWITIKDLKIKRQNKNNKKILDYGLFQMYLSHWKFVKPSKITTNRDMLCEDRQYRSDSIQGTDYIAHVFLLNFRVFRTTFERLKGHIGTVTTLVQKLKTVVGQKVTRVTFLRSVPWMTIFVNSNIMGL